MHNALSRAASLFSDDEEFEQLRRLDAWSKETADGSLSDLDFRPLPAVWDEVASDHGNCMGRACPMYGKCFYYKARRRMQNAQILVVNHALFFTDLALRRENVSILPKYDVVIFDEAHTIEAVAGDHLGLSITNGQVEYTLRKLYNDRTNRGLLVHHKLGDAQKQVWECRDRAADFFESVAAWLAAQPNGNGRVRQPDIVANPLSEGLRKLVATLRAARQADRSSPSERQDFTAAANRLDALAEGIDDWLGQQMADSVYWIERSFSRSRLRITLAAAPIDVGPDPPRAPVRQGADRRHDQRHAGHRRQRKAVVRLLPIADRADADRDALAGQPVRLSPPGPDRAARRHARPERRRPALRADGDRHDPPLRGAERRPGVRAVHQLRDDEARGGGA